MPYLTGNRQQLSRRIVCLNAMQTVKKNYSRTKATSFHYMLYKALSLMTITVNDNHLVFAKHPFASSCKSTIFEAFTVSS